MIYIKNIKLLFVFRTTGQPIDVALPQCGNINPAIYKVDITLTRHNTQNTVNIPSFIQ